MKTKPTIWYVDDLKSNLDRFATDHKNAFSVRTFDNPQQVIEALKESKPDALLCDIFFYDTERESQQIEDRVQAKARELRQFAGTIGADKESYQAGIKLIESVSSRFKGHPRFPIFAYTSKGPYILDGTGFDGIGQAGARWLFKGKYGSAKEQLVINHDIAEFRLTRFFPRLLRNVWTFAVASGVVG